MKLFMLECDGGYVKQSSTGCGRVSIGKATVVNQSGLKEIELIAKSSKKAGLNNIRLVELTVTEGECIRKY